MNEVIYAQLKKLRAKMTYVKGFWDAYDIELKEISLMQEQCLLERISITKAKTATNAPSVDALADFGYTTQELLNKYE